jgi:hypothetical protein
VGAEWEGIEWGGERKGWEGTGGIWTVGEKKQKRREEDENKGGEREIKKVEGTDGSGGKMIQKGQNDGEEEGRVGRSKKG